MWQVPFSYTIPLNGAIPCCYDIIVMALKTRYYIIRKPNSSWLYLHIIYKIFTSPSISLEVDTRLPLSLEDERNTIMLILTIYGLLSIFVLTLVCLFHSPIILFLLLVCWRGNVPIKSTFAYQRICMRDVYSASSIPFIFSIPIISTLIHIKSDQIVLLNLSRSDQWGRLPINSIWDWLSGIAIMVGGYTNTAVATWAGRWTWTGSIHQILIPLH